MIYCSKSQRVISL